MDDGRLLTVRDLVVEFHTYDGIIRAVDHVSFDMAPGEILGLVGESGCGKTVTSLSLLGLISPPGRVRAEEIGFGGRPLHQLPDRAMRRIRGNEISMIFQEPMSALNPCLTVGEQISEVLVLHRGLSWRESSERGIEMLREVGISEPARRYRQYPHQLSGGMRQRVMIAMALVCDPKLLIADEPTTALDVTVQAQILDLLVRLKSEHQAAILLITHNLGVVAEICDRVAVMYLGQIVECAPTAELFSRPLHPYTMGLLRAVPRLHEHAEERRDLWNIPGSVPSLFAVPSACRFHPRCPLAQQVCRTEEPQLEDFGGGHLARCYFAGQPLPEM